jgi:hypothetical protein
MLHHAVLGENAYLSEENTYKNINSPHHIEPRMSMGVGDECHPLSGGPTVFNGDIIDYKNHIRRRYVVWI